MNKAIKQRFLAVMVATVITMGAQPMLTHYLTTGATDQPGTALVEGLKELIPTPSASTNKDPGGGSNGTGGGG